MGGFAGTGRPAGKGSLVAVLRSSLASWSGPLLALGLCAALLIPAAEPDALAARALTRLLETDSAASFLERLGGAPIVGLELRVGVGGTGGAGRDASADPRLRRAVTSALGVAAARAREAGRPGPGGLVGATESAPETLRIALGRASDGWRAELALQREAGLEGPAVLGPWREPGRAALVPPLLAIAVALAWRRVLPALFAGIWSGASLLALAGDSAAIWLAPARGLLDVFAVYFWRELIDSFRIELIGFVLALLALVGVASRSGGMRGLVDAIAKRARGPRSAQAVAFVSGLALFFDDYANCLVVGTSLRPLADRMRVSRAKLAYIVDSTAAPVAGLSLLSTWIAFEVSTFAPQLPAVGIFENPYAIFVATLPWRFYCVFALLTVALVVVSGRDLGPMRGAEQRARRGADPRAQDAPARTGALADLEPVAGSVSRARNVLVPVGVVVGVSLFEIFRGGGGVALLADDAASFLHLEGLAGVLFAGSGAGPLLAGSLAGLWCAAWLAGTPVWRAASVLALGGAALPLPVGGALGAALGFAVAIAPALWLCRRALPGPRRSDPDSSSESHSTRGMPAAEIGRAALLGTRTLGAAIAILFMAWMIGRVCEDLGTADYLVALLAPALAPAVLPVALFGVAALVAFATGTSWGAMSILLPNVVVLAAALGADHALGERGMVVACIGAVLEGAILGDHCSPISDTTVLSSLACGCDHVEHVRTQAPYALLAAVAAIGLGYLPSLWFPAWPWPVAVLGGGALLAAVLWLWGSNEGAEPTAP